MSLPLEKVNQLIQELQKLDEKDAQQAILILESYIKSRKQKARTKPSEYLGALKHLNIDVDEECRKISDEWNRDWE